MKPPQLVAIDHRPFAPLAQLLGPQRARRLTTRVDGLRRRAGRRGVWHVNSTATGGGVAEMLQALLGYVRELGVEVRWVVIDGNDEFFEVTKRLHNRLHGAPAGHPLDQRDARLYADVSRQNAAALADLIRPGDLVVLHDPQTAGLAPALVAHGAVVVWRCHIGSDATSEVTEQAWEFLRRHIRAAHAHVFSRARYRPAFLATGTSWTIPPSIDPHAPKNVELSGSTVDAVLLNAGLLDGHGPAPVAEGQIRRPAKVLTDALPERCDPMILQVSRWDRLKDMTGVMEGFVRHVAPNSPGYLVLAGPQVQDVNDDPEGAEVYAECAASWRAQPAWARRRVMLATLPMGDVEENATIVNALQRHASIIAQKSLAEGFGLTVAEAMWKRRPVVGGRVGGIADQIVDGSGYLVDPTDLTAFGAAVRSLLSDRAAAAAMGAAAHEHVHRTYVGDAHLLRWVDLFENLLG